MILQHHQIWGGGSQEAVNTEIGGLGATITTKTALANLLEIPEINIGVFKIIGNDIHCQMKVNYNIPDNKIGDRVNNPPPHPEITSYLDKGRKVQSLGPGAFSNCVLLTDIEMMNINYIGHSAFNNTRIKRADFSYLPTTINVGDFGYVFADNPDLEYVNLGNLETPKNGSIEVTADRMFVNCNNPNLQVITKLNKYGTRMFENTNIPEYINPYVIRLENNSMRFAGFRKFEGQNVEFLGEYCFHLPNYRNLEEVIVPNCTNVRANAISGEKAQPTLIDIRRATILADSIFNRNHSVHPARIGSYTTIKIHYTMTTNTDILWAKNTKGATIEVYDANGDYDYTL